MIQNIVTSSVYDLALSILPPEFAGLGNILIPALLQVLEILLELEKDFLAPEKLVKGRLLT